MKKKVINLTAKIYDEKLISNSTGEFLSNRPWFVIFVTDPMYYCDTFKYMLQHAAKEFDGKVQFAYIYENEDAGLTEAFRLTAKPGLFYIS